MYVDNFVVYTGKSDDGPTKNLGHKVVMEEIFWGKDTMSIVAIILQVDIHLAADLLEHGTNLIGTTWPNGRNFPSETVNKGAVAGKSRGTSISTIIDNKVHCSVWLDNKPVFC